jgi:nucleoside-diphosphate-sugar epimerase
MAKRVFITGGTGQLAACILGARRHSTHDGTGTNGPHVCKALVAAGHHVVALVRNPNKAEAVELRDLGVELLLGDTRCAPRAIFMRLRDFMRFLSYCARLAAILLAKTLLKWKRSGPVTGWSGSV